MALRNIILLTSNADTASSVTAALDGNGKLTTDHICRDFAQISRLLKEISPPAVIVDIDDQPQRTLAAMEPLARRYSDTKFIVLSATLRQDLLREAMQAGARDFLVKESVSSELDSVLHRICRADHGEQLGGLVTVLSAGGGCGATTACVNLATELQIEATESDRPALILDLDTYYAGVSSYFGIDSDYGVFDLLTRGGAIDSQLIQSTAINVGNRTHVLLGLPRKRLGEVPAMEPDRLLEAIDACRRVYRWTVVDAARLSPAVAARLVRNSAATLLMMQMTVKDIRVARQMTIALSEQGIHSETLTFVANRYRRRGGLVALDEAEKTLALEKNTLVTLSNDFAAVNEAVNFGKPLAISAKRSDYRKDLQKLAARVAQHSAVGAGVKVK